MSSTLYVVAYRSRYRHNYYALPPRLPNRMFLRGFSRREDAEAFMAQAPLPFHINPFEEPWTFVSVTGQLCAFRSFGDPFESEDDVFVEMPLPQFCTWIESLGLASPRMSSEKDEANQILHDWWDETVPHMTDEQKHALWSWCDPEPYEIVEVELEEAT
jgi:hypothetical protein